MMIRKIKLFILFALLLLIVVGYKTYEQYHHIENTQKTVILNESQTLAHFISAFRQTYQDIFIRNHIDVNEITIKLLPITTIKEIGSRFSSSVESNVVIRTVSDKPKNLENMANDFELDMIRYFKKHPEEKERFVKKENAFFYTQPLYVQESCLKCHGKREEVIPSIRDKYAYTYDYKLGDILGLMTIKISDRKFFAPMYTDFIDTLIGTIFFYILFLIVIYILIKRLRLKDQLYTDQLKSDIEDKTHEIKKQKEAFETLFEKSSDGILILDGNKIVQCNEKVVGMLGYNTKEELLNIHPYDTFPERQPDGRKSNEKVKEMIAIAKEHNGHQFEWVYIKPNGDKFLADIMLTPLTLDNRDVIHVAMRDISNIKKAQEALMEQKDILDYQAHHDDLTGLPNRTLFNDRLEHGIELSKRHGTKLALFFIDLDKFKQINDSLGHHVGDKVLVAVSERIKAKIREEDTVSRLGGDEFTIIMDDLKELEDVSLFAQKIQKVLTEPIYVEGHTIHTSCSIGISIYPNDDTDANNLIKYADTAMYKAKEEGRNNFQFYSSDMTRLSLERMVMKNSLLQAIDNEEFTIYYQPQLDVTTGKITGMEALIRWNHPVMGLLLPERFIPLAEESGFIVELDRWVMSTAMRQIYKWHEAGFDPGVLALNLSMRQLRSDDFIQILQECMKAIDFKPEWLMLEITETDLMRKPEESMMKLAQINRLGVEIVIDNFGTGYSSLRYLKRLPVKRLKIDRSLIKGIPTDRENVAIVKSIIALGNNLELVLTAEGVESDAQKEFLLESGCKIIQGYYCGEPMSSEQLVHKCFDINNRESKR